jgi:hypothetical protein
VYVCVRVQAEAEGYLIGGEAGEGAGETAAAPSCTQQ